MNRLIGVIFVSGALSLGLVHAAQAEPFRNLDFESAILPEPNPDGLGGALPVSEAFPNWTLRINSAPYDWVLHNNGYMDWAFAAVYDWRAKPYRSGLRHVIEGRVEAALGAGNWEVPGPGPGPGTEVFAPVSISQVGTVPEDAKSIHMLVRPYLDPFTVTLGGEPISMISVAQFPEGVTEYAGSVTGLAGATAELTITALPEYGGVVLVDAISFSPVPVPEPSSLALGALGFVGLVWCATWRKRRQR